MITRKAIFLLLFLSNALFAFCTPSNYTLVSPNKKLSVCIKTSDNNPIKYSFSANKKLLIDDSDLGFVASNNDIIPSKEWRITDVSKSKVRKTWKPVWGKRAIVPDSYNEIELTFTKDNNAAIGKIILSFRLYNDGMAFKYSVPSNGKDSVKIASERTSYNFADDYTAWFYNNERHNIGPERLSDGNGTRKPVMTIKVDANNYMALHEAYLIDGQPLLLESKKGDKSFNVSSKPSKLYPGYESAWRVVLYGTTPGDLVDSHIIELLNPEPKEGTDFSWVKPGVALWDWRMDGAIVDGFEYKMSYPSWVRAVDFAAEQGMKYLVLDANWYGPEFESNSDPVKGDKANDVKKLIKYAKDKGVGIWLYLNDVGGKKYSIEQTLKQYGEWGAAGVKYGFMIGTQEEKNKWTQYITQLCAQNKLLVDYHDDPVHPYGQMRTWPNAITREFCQAQLDARRVFYPKTFVTSVFVNMIAGPIDMNNGMFDLRQGKTTRKDCNLEVPSTLVSEAARTLITFSGATIIPDVPEFYKKYPSLLNFISSQKMPWIESKTLAGEIGEYIVMMRENKDAILIGAATNESPREIALDMSFLKKGNYEAEIIQDGKDAHYLTNRESYTTEKRTINNKDTIRLKLAAGGGACINIKKAETK